MSPAEDRRLSDFFEPSSDDPVDKNDIELLEATIASTTRPAYIRKGSNSQKTKLIQFGLHRDYSPALVNFNILYMAPLRSELMILNIILNLIFNLMYQTLYFKPQILNLIRGIADSFIREVFQSPRFIVIHWNFGENEWNFRCSSLHEANQNILEWYVKISFMENHSFTNNSSGAKKLECFEKMIKKSL